MITEQDLSILLGIPNLEYDLSTCGRSIHYGNKEKHISEFISIYELSDMCKHKITSKFPMFSIKWHPNHVKGTPPACVKVWVQGELLGNQPTEPEAVFQAYQELLTKGLL